MNHGLHRLHGLSDFRVEDGPAIVHPQGEHDSRPKCFVIRVIRVIRGFYSGIQDKPTSRIREGRGGIFPGRGAAGGRGSALHERRIRAVAQVCGGDGCGAEVIRGGACSGRVRWSWSSSSRRSISGCAWRVRMISRPSVVGRCPSSDLHRGQLHQCRPRGQPGGARTQPGFEGDLQGVGQERDADVGFDAVVELMVDGSVWRWPRPPS